MKLIKIGEDFILANKQEIKIGDVTLEKDNSGNYFMPKIVMDYQLNDNSGIKVIASTNYLDDSVYKIYLNDVKKIVCGFNIEKIAEEKFPRRNSFSVYEAGQRDGFIKGFLESLSVNSDKKFTYDEMVMIYNLGREEKSKSQVMGKYYDTHKEFIGYDIEKQSEWDVEIQMRSKNIDELRESKEGFLNNHNLNVPVIENGHINIIKIISNETN